ncbi:MAG TPA: antitoxin [Sediminispirochaeta sp.]|nr:antitoxin [Sediminispirochaeta sp.]
MANLQVKDIDESLYETLRSLAAHERRSISQEVVYILQKYLSKPDDFEANQTDEFLKLAGSWRDEREAEEILLEIREGRKNSSRFGKDNELLD